MPPRAAGVNWAGTCIGVDGRPICFQRSTACILTRCALDAQRGPAVASTLIDQFLRHASPLLQAVPDTIATRDLAHTAIFLSPLKGSAAILGGLRFGALNDHLITSLMPASVGSVAGALL